MTRTKNGFGRLGGVRLQVHKSRSRTTTKRYIVIYVDETQDLVAGNSLDDGESQYQFYVDDGYSDEPESASADAPVAISADTPKNRRSDRPLAKIVAHQRTLDGDALCSRSEPSLVDAHPRSHTEPNRHGLGAGVLRAMRSSQQGSTPRPPPHEDVGTAQFYNPAALPLKDRTEAVLFRHYLEKIAVCVSSQSSIGETTSPEYCL